MVAELTTAYNVRKMLPFIREDGNYNKNNTDKKNKKERKHHTLNITGC